MLVPCLTAVVFLLTVHIGFSATDNSAKAGPPTVESFDGQWLAGNSADQQRILSNEEALFKKLFGDYNKNIRANYNTTDPLKVELGLAIRRIEYLDEKRQTLLFHGVTRMRWTDQRLAWVPEDYDQVKNIAYSSFALWIPDILLNNEADPFGTKNFQHGLANVYHDGQVLLSSPSAFKVYCGMDFGKWPYDEQLCVIEFESFTNDGTRVDLQPMGPTDDSAVEVANFSSSNTWRVSGAKAMKQIKRYECCQGEYHSVYFALRLTRKEHLYGPLLLGPIVAMIFGSWLIFLLPLESTTKFVFGGLQLTFVGFFAVFLKHTLPPCEEVPYIASLTINAMILILLALFVEFFLQWISRLKSRMPAAVRTFFLGGMSRACCLKMANAYTKPTIHISNGGGTDQEVDHFEMDEPGATVVAEKNRQEWLTLATVLSRISFGVYVAVSLVILI